MNEARNKVAVVGGGRMGCGIAQVLALAGHPVWIFEPSSQARALVPQRLQEVLDDLDRVATSNVEVVADLGLAVAAADLVIEAGPEQLDVKQNIFADLGRLAPVTATLATNTSAIPVAKIAAKVADKRRVLGTHFWNPPHLVTLVEVVQAPETGAEVVAATMDVLARAGMEPVHVRSDIPGFIGNRLQHALKREAIALVAAGHCSAETVDRVVKHGFGARLGALGPLEQADLIGLELTLGIHRTVLPALDRTPEPQTLLVEKVAAGKTGAAVGEGFRTWRPGEADALRRRVTSALIERRRKQLADTERKATAIHEDDSDGTGG
jgi:3-hydroxybutyryl-CoA dehydrogenase